MYNKSKSLGYKILRNNSEDILNIVVGKSGKADSIVQVFM